MSTAALAAADEADRIPVDRRWPPAFTLAIIIVVPALVWVLVWAITHLP